MLDQKHMSPVSKYNRNKRDGWKAANQTGNEHENIFEKLLEDFKSVAYIAATPRDDHYAAFLEKEKCKWDHNNITIFENKQDAVWLKKTLEKCVK